MRWRNHIAPCCRLTEIFIRFLRVSKYFGYSWNASECSTKNKQTRNDNMKHLWKLSAVCDAKNRFYLPIIKFVVQLLRVFVYRISGFRYIQSLGLTWIAKKRAEQSLFNCLLSVSFCVPSSERASQINFIRAATHRLTIVSIYYYSRMNMPTDR